MSNKRYFINNYLKSKFAMGKVYGEPKCFFCGSSSILDLHHIYIYKKEKNSDVYYKNGVNKIIFVCPTHHSVFHRLIDSWSSYPNYYYKNYPNYDVASLKKRIKFLDNEKDPYYLKGEIKPYFVTMKVDQMKKRYGSKFIDKERKKKGNVITFDSNYRGRVGYSGFIKWFKKEDINSIPKCFICEYKIVLDAHHIYKDKRVIFLCPNHHHMIHRHLNDPNGEKTTLEEIKKGIKEIEKDVKPYFQEISEEEYQKYKNYNIMKIKE